MKKQIHAIALPVAISFLMASTSHAEGWVKLTTDEVKTLYTNSKITGRTERGPFTLMFGNQSGCGKLVAGNGNYIRYRYMDFDDNGGYSIIQKDETNTYPGVEKKGKKYRWIDKKNKFKIKPLKEKKAAKITKQLTKEFPEKCAGS